MPLDETVRVTGLRELVRAADRAGKETKKAVRTRLRKVGEAVREDAAGKFSVIDTRTASKFGVSVRATGIVSVEQRLRKTTGLRPDYGALQMTHALMPALEENEDNLEREMERAVDDIVDIFERRP